MRWYGLRMIVLIHLLRWFNTCFGLTQARKEEERKWALYLVCVLLFMGSVMVAAVAVLLSVLNTRR